MKVCTKIFVTTNQLLNKYITITYTYVDHTIIRNEYNDKISAQNITSN